MMPEKRVKLAGEFMRATLTGHSYEEYVKEALDEYRKLMGAGNRAATISAKRGA